MMGFRTKWEDILYIVERIRALPARTVGYRRGGLHRSAFIILLSERLFFIYYWITFIEEALIAQVGD